MTTDIPQVLLHLAPYLPPAPEQMVSRAQGTSVILNRQQICLRAWEKVFGEYDGSNGYGDYEDWTEQAYRLVAAIDAFGEQNIWVMKGANATVAVNYQTGEEKPEGEATKGFIRYGSQPYMVYYNRDQIVERHADSYAYKKVFGKYANRAFYVCGFSLGGAEGIDIKYAVLSLHNEGIRKLVIKNTKAKKGFWKVELPDSLDAKLAGRIISSELDWALIREEGNPQAFLVQEYIPMEYEYRFFVVNHKVVTGAACIEENTPLNNTEAFDSWFRRERNDIDAPLIKDEVLRDRLLAFAQEIALYTESQENECSNYVVDVALNSKGEPLMIERNSMLNSGFFASDPRLITASLRPAGGAVRP